MSDDQKREPRKLDARPRRTGFKSTLVCRKRRALDQAGEPATVSTPRAEVFSISQLSDDGSLTREQANALFAFMIAVAIGLTVIAFVAGVIVGLFL